MIQLFIFQAHYSLITNQFSILIRSRSVIRAVTDVVDRSYIFSLEARLLTSHSNVSLLARVHDSKNGCSDRAADHNRSANPEGCSDKRHPDETPKRRNIRSGKTEETRLRPVEDASRPVRRQNHGASAYSINGDEFNQREVGGLHTGAANPDCEVNRDNQRMQHRDAERIAYKARRAGAFHDHSQNHNHRRHDQRPLQNSFQDLPPLHELLFRMPTAIAWKFRTDRAIFLR